MNIAKKTTEEPLSGWERFLNLRAIQERRASQFTEHIDIPHWDKHREALSQLPAIESSEIIIDDCITVKQLEKTAPCKIEDAIKTLIPWRTGPYNLFGYEIDAEWRSSVKWNLIKKALPNLENRRIADVGCNSGYFMFQLLRYDPQLVIGLDPSGRCYYQFHLINRFIRSTKLHFEPFGIEHFDLFSDFFHVAFCMGVIYHRRDPHTACRLLYESIKPGGTLIMESIVIAGDESVALCPAGRYAKMPNVWFLPTVACMTGWLRKAGFGDIELVHRWHTTADEQRTTTLAPYESFADFIDPVDNSKTVEGFPAPERAVLIAHK